MSPLDSPPFPLAWRLAGAALFLFLGACTSLPPGKVEAGSAGDAAVLREGLSVLLRVLYPACPHITHVLWQELGFEKGAGSLLDAHMPTVDESALVRDEIELVLQVNGKARGAVRVAATADKAAIEAAALASEPAQKYLEGKPPKKVVVVPGRLVNIVA